MSFRNSKMRIMRAIALSVVSICLVIVVFSGSPAKIPRSAVFEKESIRKTVLEFDGTILKVVDGDTVRVSILGKEEKVRLIGINAPELFSSNGEIDCLGDKSLKSAKEVLKEGMIVRIISDTNVDDRDKYGRLLRYVVTPAGEDIGEKQISLGLAVENGYGSAYMKQALYKNNEIKAKGDSRGLWADTACSDTKI